MKVQLLQDVPATTCRAGEVYQALVSPILSYRLPPGEYVAVLVNEAKQHCGLAHSRYLLQLYNSAP